MLHIIITLFCSPPPVLYIHIDREQACRQEAVTSRHPLQVRAIINCLSVVLVSAFEFELLSLCFVAPPVLSG